MPLPFADKMIRPSLQVTEAVVEPVGECRPEWEILDEIARRMGLGSADSAWIQRQMARVLSELSRVEADAVDLPDYPLRLVGMREMRSHNS